MLEHTHTDFFPLSLLKALLQPLPLKLVYNIAHSGSLPSLPSRQYSICQLRFAWGQSKEQIRVSVAIPKMQVDTVNVSLGIDRVALTGVGSDHFAFCRVAWCCEHFNRTLHLSNPCNPIVLSQRVLLVAASVRADICVQCFVFSGQQLTRSFRMESFYGASKRWSTLHRPSHPSILSPLNPKLP